MDPRREARGWVTAFDAATERHGGASTRPRRWSPASRPPQAASRSRPTRPGTIYAFDTRTGAVRWRHDAGMPVGGGVVTYAVGGRQYVAVAAGLHAP
jgi:alcohol dehydrogenase (cytochrome c)